MARWNLTLTERFWSKVAKGPATECWLWTGPGLKFGYGRIKIDGRHVLAHRAAYELTQGPIPPGSCVLHACDNPPCCNPDHLNLGTYRDNNSQREARGRGRQPKGEGQAKAKLTEADVRMIRASAASSGTLARQLGVSYRLIWLVRTGKNWTHVA